MGRDNESLPETGIPLGRVVDPVALDEMVSAGFVKRTLHPELPYAIYNYTPQTQYERAWNPVTLGCRGLVTRLPGVDAASRLTSREVVVARPWPKFFNHQEHPAEHLCAGEPVCVTEKMDGSLGIGVPTEVGLLVATRGSFTSEQAVHATGVLGDRYGEFQSQPGWTYLWEIVYPANRIVVDYGSFDDLVLLGAVDVESGRSVPLAEVAATWPGPVVETHPFVSFQEAVSAPPRPNCEGVVVHFVESDRRVKIKQEDYVALHRIVTSLTERSVWEVLRDTGALNLLLDVLPDEYYPWLHEVAARLQAAHQAEVARVEAEYTAVVAELESAGVRAADPVFRREFAGLARRSTTPGWLFARLDGRSFDEQVWRQLRPEAVRPPGGADSGEDAA